MENEPEISPDYLPMDPKRLLERVHTALNTRDLTNLLHCLQVDYEQIYPAKNKKDTTGLEAARETWEMMFRSYPDFQADLMRQAFEAHTIWSEWHWHGSHSRGQGSGINQAGVIIFGVEEGLIAWSRSFMIDVS